MNVAITTCFEQDFANSGSFHVNGLQILPTCVNGEFGAFVLTRRPPVFIETSFRSHFGNRVNFGNPLRVFRETASTWQSQWSSHDGMESSWTKRVKTES